MKQKKNLKKKLKMAGIGSWAGKINWYQGQPISLPGCPKSAQKRAKNTSGQ